MRYHSYKGIISYIYKIEKPGGYVPLTLIIRSRLQIIYDAERPRTFHNLSGHLFWEDFSLSEVTTAVECNQVYM